MFSTFVKIFGFSVRRLGEVRARYLSLSLLCATPGELLYPIWLPMVAFSHRAHSTEMACRRAILRPMPPAYAPLSVRNSRELAATSSLYTNYSYSVHRTMRAREITSPHPTRPIAHPLARWAKRRRKQEAFPDIANWAGWRYIRWRLNTSSRHPTLFCRRKGAGGGALYKTVSPPTTR